MPHREKKLNGKQQVPEHSCDVEMGFMLRNILKHSQRGKMVNVVGILNICAANMSGQIILSKRVFETEGEEANEVSIRLSCL